MPCTEPSKRRWKPVRVASVPLERRMNAAREAMKRAEDDREAARIFLLALEPGELVAWVAP